MIVDVDPSHQQSEMLDIDLPEPTRYKQPSTQELVDGPVYIATRLGARRQSFRSARHLLNRVSRSSLVTPNAGVAMSGWPRASTGC
ncbi:hypothetical protein [Nonomuraea ceibae]|uniref:hypothetical protein n=1 Tax=Nonomuraea ceibae TaxID=1935170 RepID=UPI001C5F8E4E|nr:hypothetical protein [Nonomuraea ceibae]